MQEQVRSGVSDPSLPRKRCAPQCFEDGASAGYFLPTAADHYQQIFFEAIDHVIQAIRNRFDQPGYGIYQNQEALILNSSMGKPYDNELQFICDFYKDLLMSQFQAQLPLLIQLVQEAQETSSREVNVKEIVSVLAGLSTAEKVAFSSVLTAVKFLLVMPATNSTSEHSFAALQCVKTYLRTTKTQQPLNSLMVLHVHKASTDSLDLMEVA